MPRFYSGNPFFKLPFGFDVNALQADLVKCQVFDFNDHFNPRDYEGGWTIIYLRSPGGKMDDVPVVIGQSAVYHDTTVLSACAYFKQVIDTFDCPKESIRLMNLHAHSKIKPHSDKELGYEDGVFRLHIPIQTNEQVRFIVDDQALPMQSGESWYANFNRIHEVHNDSNTDRIHLVMDCIRNEWSDELFRSLGYDFEAEKQAPPVPDETTLRMIEEMERMNNPAMQETINQLKASLKGS